MIVRDATGRVLGDLPDPNPSAAVIGVGRSVPLPDTGPDLGMMPEQLRPSWLRRYRRRNGWPSMFFNVDLRKRRDASGELYLEADPRGLSGHTVAWLPHFTPADQG